MRRTVLALLAALLLAAGCGDDPEVAATPTPTPEATETPAATAEPAAGCEAAAAPEPKDASFDAPEGELDASKTYVATVETNCGTFEITLDPKDAPKTGASFKFLADEGFYDGLAFHRIVADFVVQGGDPLGDGTGGPGYSVEEAPPSDLKYVKGVVAMAKTQAEPAGTSGSQFFVVTAAEDTGLPADYALLGEVTEGQDVVDAIAQVEVDAQDAPAAPVVMTKVTVEER